MKTYQRAVVALIRATGSRLCALDDHRLVDLWRQYSASLHCGGWVKGSRAEVYRFVTWSNTLCGITQEVWYAHRARKSGRTRIRARAHPVCVWDGPPLIERRLR